jgi:hypothetical protein
MHGIARTAAQECRKTQLDAVDLGLSHSFAARADYHGDSGGEGGDHHLLATGSALTIDPFVRDQVTLGAAREGTSRGMQLHVPHLYPSHHISKHAQSSPLKVSAGQALPPGKIAVRVRATSISFSNVLRRAFGDATTSTAVSEEESAPGAEEFVGFSGTVMDSGTFFSGDVGTAVFGVMTHQQWRIKKGTATESGVDPRAAASSMQVVDAAMCHLKPDGLTFEEAAVLPSPHIAALSYLAAIQPALSSLSSPCSQNPGGGEKRKQSRRGDRERVRKVEDEGKEVIVVLQEYPTCPIARALAWWLDRSTDHVRWIPGGAGAGAGHSGDDCIALPPGVKTVAAVVGNFGTQGAVAAALGVVRRRGILVKTSSGAIATMWCTETVRNVMSGAGIVSGSFLRDSAAADSFVSRPDVTCADAVTTASLLRNAPAALTTLARAIAEDGGAPVSHVATALSRRIVSLPAATVPLSDTATTMRGSLARYAMGTTSSSCPTLAVYAHHAHTPTVARCPKPVLISGGLGALGIEISLWLAQHHPVRVHLLGRSGRRSSAGGSETDRAPDALGAHAGVVTIHRSDASRTEECFSVAEILRSTASNFNQQEALGAVLHASGRGVALEFSQ